MPIGNAGRTSRLTCAAAEALRNMRLDCLAGRLERAFEECPHQHDAPAGTVVLVLERKVGRAALETEPAVHTGVDARALVGERTGWKGTLRRHDVRRAHAGSPRIPAF